MVVKTELCHYTEYKIYPGHGQKFVGKDAKITFFLSQKAEKLFHQKIKAVKLTWTAAWRRMHGRGKVEQGARRKKATKAKFNKAIVGLSLDDMKNRRKQKTTFRQAAKEQAEKEAKSRVTKRGGAAAGSKREQPKIKAGKAMGGAQKQKNFKR